MAEGKPELEWHAIEESSALGIYFVMEGRPSKVKVNGTTFCVVRKGEELFFVRNRCPHAGGQLSQGWVDSDGYLVCPMHRFRFSLQEGVPSPEGYPLHAFPWKMDRGTVHVGFPKRRSFFNWF